LRNRLQIGRRNQGGGNLFCHSEQSDETSSFRLERTHSADKTSCKAQGNRPIRPLRRFARAPFCTDRRTILSFWWGSLPNLHRHCLFHTQGCRYCRADPPNNLKGSQHGFVVFYMKEAGRCQVFLCNLSPSSAVRPVSVILTWAEFATVAQRGVHKGPQPPCGRSRQHR
jgi:hypothetical protein